MRQVQLPRRAAVGGFTLIEILIAIAISSVVMLLVATTLVSTMRARNQVGSLTESTEAGSRVLNLLERDLRGLWTHNIKKNRVLIGRNRDIASAAADRIDFLTHTDSISTIETTDERPGHASICEVGYWLKSNPNDDLMMELWRREDPMVDDDLVRGGTFQKVHDRVRSFNITYYKSLGKNAEEFNDWDTSTEATLPRVIKIEFTIERKLAADASRSAEIEDFESNSKKYTRFIVLEKEFMETLTANKALIPVFPTRPSQGKGGSPGEGGAGPTGGGAGPTGGGAGPAMGQGVRGNRPTTVVQKRGDDPRPGGNRGGTTPPPNLFPRGGNGNINLNDLFRQLGGGRQGGNPFGGR